MAIAGTSPEMMVAVEDGIAETRPIAGTRPRGKTPQEDQALAEELLDDDKERAEKGIETQLVVNGDCTMCGRCFDVCHTDAYNYEFRLKDLV